MVTFHEDYTTFLAVTSGAFRVNDSFRPGIVCDSPFGLLLFAHQVGQLAHLGMTSVSIVRVLNPDIECLGGDVAASPLHPLPQQALLAISVHLECWAFTPCVRCIECFAVCNAPMATLHRTCETVLITWTSCSRAGTGDRGQFLDGADGGFAVHRGEQGALACLDTRGTLAQPRLVVHLACRFHAR